LNATRHFDFASQNVGIVIIGHGENRSIREELVRDVRAALPNTPVVALLRRDEEPIRFATENIRADDPVAWVKRVSTAIKAVH
jgi:hypothetical protein